MTTLINLKLNSVLNELKSIEDTTANQDVLNAVIKYMNDNPDKFDATVDITKLNQFVQEYLVENASLFKGDPPSDADIQISLKNYFNKSSLVSFVNANFTNITTDNTITCGNSLLTYYTPTNTTEQVDIRTNNIQAKNISSTNAQITGLSSNIITSIGEASGNNKLITVADNMKVGNTTIYKTTTNNADLQTNKIVFSSLSNNGSQIIVNESLNIGNNNIYSNKVVRNNDFETGMLQVAQINSATQPSAFVFSGKPFSPTLTYTKFNEMASFTKSIIVPEILASQPTRTLNLGQDGDTLSINGTLSFTKDLACNTNFKTDTIYSNTKPNINVFTDLDLKQNGKNIYSNNSISNICKTNQIVAYDSSQIQIGNDINVFQRNVYCNQLLANDIVAGYNNLYFSFVNWFGNSQLELFKINLILYTDKSLVLQGLVPSGNSPIQNLGAWFYLVNNTNNNTILTFKNIFGNTTSIPFNSLSVVQMCVYTNNSYMVLSQN